MRKKIFPRNFFSIISLFLFINACAKTQQVQQNANNVLSTVDSKDIAALTPEQVVTLYFQAWNDKKYDVMYPLISEGFKQIEPTAKTFNDFKVYMEEFYDAANGVNIIKAKEVYKNEKEAGVDYKIEIMNKDGTNKEFSSTYTLKKRTSGWKLIHPYGKNIDTT